MTRFATTLATVLVVGCGAGISCSPTSGPNIDTGFGVDASFTDSSRTRDVTFTDDARRPDGGTVSDASSPSWDIARGCNPLAYREDCLFPFPSDFFRTADPTSPTGYRVRLDPPAQVETSRGLVDPLRTRPIDGAPAHPQLVVYLSEGFADDFPGPDDAASTNPDWTHRTLLIDVERGELIPHFAEPFEGFSETRGKLLALRPLVRLRDEARYIVALRELRNLAGEPIDAPAGFREIRDGALNDAPPWVAAEAARLEREVLGPLAELGVPRESLVLAWDFTIESEASSKRDLRAMRADAVERMNANPIQVRVTSVIEGAELPGDLSRWIHRRIDGELLVVPSYLEGIDGNALRRGADQLPTLSGNTVVPFTALIPVSVAENIDEGPSRIVQFGHGFFGSREEIVDNWQYVVANRLQYVIIAVDWWGFSEDDFGDFLPALTTNLAEAFRFGDRLAQAMVNQLALERAIAGPLRNEAAFTLDGRNTYDPDEHYFLGVSGGGIFGGVFAALTERIDRFVLNVGGSSYGLIMSRSDAFGALGLLLRQSLGELGAHHVTAFAPYSLAFVDPVTWAPDVAASTSRVLYQIGLGDTAVPTLAGELAARTLDATLVAPSPRYPPLLAQSEAAIDGNALLIVDFGVDPEIGRPWKSIREDTVAHEGVRRFSPAIEMMDEFFGPDGVVRQTCQGPCRDL